MVRTSRESKDSALYIVLKALFRKYLDTTSNLLTNLSATYHGSVSDISWIFDEHSIQYFKYYTQSIVQNILVNGIAALCLPSHKYHGSFHSYSECSRPFIDTRCVLLERSSQFRHNLVHSYRMILLHSFPVSKSYLIFLIIQNQPYLP